MILIKKLVCFFIQNTYKFNTCQHFCVFTAKILSECSVLIDKKEHFPWLSCLYQHVNGRYRRRFNKFFCGIFVIFLILSRQCFITLNEHTSVENWVVSEDHIYRKAPVAHI